MNKGLFKLFCTFGFIFSLSLLLALSCNKSPGENGTNSSNSGGGGNSGGGNTALPPEIIFTNFDESVAIQLPTGEIKLKPNGFPTKPVAGLGLDYLGTASDESYKRAFDITIARGKKVALGGLILVGPGNLTKENFSIDQGITNIVHDSLEKKTTGIVGTAPTPVGTFNDVFKRGWNIFSLFMDNNASDSADKLSPDAAPFAFSSSSGRPQTKPLFFCRTTIRSVTKGQKTQEDGTLQKTTRLWGAQIASCYVGGLGTAFTGKTNEIWLTQAHTNANFKRKFNIAVLGAMTEEKTLAELGFDDDQLLDQIREGISSEIINSTLASSGRGAYKKVSIEIVDDGFKPSLIVFENFDPDVAEMVGDTIRIKASGLLTQTTPTYIDKDSDLTSVLSWIDSSNVKRMFDITISTGGEKATGGLVLAGPGNFANASSFSLGALSDALTPGSGKNTSQGVFSTQPVSSSSLGREIGWNIFGSFMGNGPYAFSSTWLRPIVFCRTTISTIKTSATLGDGSAKSTTQLTGGQKASCYVAVLSYPFSDRAATTWLKKAATDPNFKGAFDMAVVGIQTDQKTIDQIGFAGDAAAFRDGLSSDEMTRLAWLNSSAYKKVSIEVVKDAAFSDYTKPSPPDISITIEDPDVAEIVGDTIKIKADGLLKKTFSSNVNAIMDNSLPTGTYLYGFFKKAFQIYLRSGRTTVRHGIILVDSGDLKSVNDFSMARGFYTKIEDYSPTQWHQGTVTDYTSGQRTEIYRYFIDPNNPQNAAEMASDAAPFAFSSSSSGSISVKPALVCFNNPGSYLPDTRKELWATFVDCFVGVSGFGFDTEIADDWFKQAESTPNFKTKFDIAIAAIQTDQKYIETFGLSGGNNALDDNLTTSEMAQLAAEHPSSYRKLSIEIVRGSVPDTPTPPAATLDIDNFDSNVRLNGNTIEIKAGAFPSTAADSDLSATISNLATAPTDSLKRIFDITVTGGYAGATTGGLVMVGPGNFTKIDDFQDRYVSGQGGIREIFNENEGFGSGILGIRRQGVYRVPGWNFYGVFMNQTTPSSSDSASSPFAFTPIAGSQPFVFCRATVTSITDYLVMKSPLRDGYKASCYIGSKGAAFTGATATTWLNKVSSASFKKKFDMAIGGFRTDDDTYVGFIPESRHDGERTQKIDFEKGLRKGDLGYIATKYPTAFKNVSVTIVSDTAW